MRQVLIVGDAENDRTIEITTQEQLVLRAGLGLNSTDNRRYVSWFTSDAQTHGAAYRTSLTITPALALITIPAPGTGVVLLACFFTRRRR